MRNYCCVVWPHALFDFGESPEDALVREFKEETGLVIRAGSLVTIDTLNDESHGNQYHSIRIVYKAHYVSGELAFEQEGSTDRCEWFSESEARQQLLVPLAQLLHMLHAAAPICQQYFSGPAHWPVEYRSPCAQPIGRTSSIRARSSALRSIDAP